MGKDFRKLKSLPLGPMIHNSYSIIHVQLLSPLLPH